MTAYRRVGRWALIVVTVLVAGWVLLRVGVGVYLRTPAGRAVVAQQLQEVIGLPVEVSEVDLGSRSSSLKFRVLEPATGPSPPAEVLSVESATADVSFTDLITRNVAPKELTLRGVNLTLRLDAEGKVLTALPHPTAEAGKGPPPRITIENARVHIKQQGQPDFAVSGIAVKAEPRGQKLTLSGTIDDPSWAKWTITGEADTAAKTGWAEASTADGPLKVELLKSLPYVPPSIWDDLHPSGRGSGKLRAALGADKKLDYLIEVVPKEAALTVPAADATLTGATGSIKFRDAKLTLENCKAHFAGGTVGAGGVWDFNPPQSPTGEKLASAGEVKVTADGLDSKDVPASWGLNKDLGGKLSGAATVRLKVYADGRIDPEGTTGDGKLTGVTFLGQPQEDIPIHVGREGQRIRLKEGQSPGAEGPKAGSRAEPKRKGWSQFADRVTADSSRHTPCAVAAPRVGGADGTRSVPATLPDRAARTRASSPADLLAALLLTALQPAKKAADEPTTIDATIRLRDVDVAQLIDKLQLKIPYHLAGRVSVELKVAVPLAQASNRGAYRFHGTLTSPEFHAEGLTVRDLAATVNYGDGKLSLTALKGRIPQSGGGAAEVGSFAGSASLAIDPPGDAAADLTIDRIPLGEVARAVPGFTVEVRGLVTGKATFRAPYDKVEDPTTWAASAELRSDELTVAGRTAKGVTLAAAIDKGTAKLTNAAATIEGVPVTADASLELTGARKYTATVRTSPINVADLRKLIPEANLAVPVEGLLETEARASGTLSPFTVAAGGTLQAKKLAIGKTAANHIALKWAFDQDRVALSDLKAELFGGTLSGAADVPLDPQKAGTFHVEFKDLDAGAAAALIPDFPVKITGKVSGKVAGGLPPAKPGEPRTATADIDLTAPKLTVQGIPAERLTGKFGIEQGAFRYDLEGRALGGSFEVKGRYPGPKKAPAGDGQNGQPPKGDRGSLRIEGLDLARLADIGFATLRPLAGTLDLTLNYANDLSEGTGRVTVRGLKWGAAAFSPDLTGVVVMRDGAVEIAELGGRFAGGTLRARGRVFVRNPDRNFFLVTIDRADPKRLFAPVPELADAVRGDVSITVHGRFGRETRGSGTVTVARGSLGGVAVSELRIPFDFASSPGGYGRFTVRDIGGQAGAGIIQGGLTFNWGAENRLDGQLRFVNARLRSISPSLGESGLFGNGRITGRLDLSGTNIRSADDINGTLVAAFLQTSVREIPILSEISPFLSTQGLLLQPFQTGDIRGRLSRGVFRIERLALNSPSAQLFADGSVTLRGGRLDLNVVAHTGQAGPSVRALRLFGLRLPPIGPIPITLIRDVSDFLSNRTIRLTVGGTVSAPVVQVNAAALLGDEAVRFFLSRYVLPAEAAGALGFGAGVGGVIGGTTSGGSMRSR